MNESDKNFFLDAIRQILQEHRTIDNETHRDHHEFVKILITERKQRMDRHEKIRTQVYGWGIISLLGIIGSAVYHFFTRGN